MASDPSLPLLKDPCQCVQAEGSTISMRPCLASSCAPAYGASHNFGPEVPTFFPASAPCSLKVASHAHKRSERACRLGVYVVYSVPLPSHRNTSWSGVSLSQDHLFERLLAAVSLAQKLKQPWTWTQLLDSWKKMGGAFATRFASSHFSSWRYMDMALVHIFASFDVASAESTGMVPFMSKAASKTQPWAST